MWSVGWVIGAGVGVPVPVVGSGVVGWVTGTRFGVAGSGVVRFARSTPREPLIAGPVAVCGWWGG
ncbi:hypothetical protein UO65_0997 [Actinokineospora spheciospongiae]|uniref:Uncharacterized protein n=1 Tax=Actinokineospora spheciospongiae TaxID=909613 RepID=W7IS01_9PSEU|nr:hypothetical protein UO65_0997 [Actinokineospora spheciospongiae]